MDTPNLADVNPTNPGNWMGDIPGGDIPLDSLFPNPDVAQPASAAPSPAAAPTPVPPPQADPIPAPPADNGPFMRTNTGTIYRTMEDAIRGTEVKDTTIERLRSYAIQATGIDPLTGRQAAPQPAATVPSANTSYSSNPDKYFTDLEAAVKVGDKKKYLEIQGSFVREQVQAQTASAVPYIADAARMRAEEQVSRELPNFRAIRASDAYREALDEIPDLKAAIENAESNLTYAASLPQLYKTAHYAALGKQALSKPPQPSVPATPPPPATRPTLVPNTLTPPVPNTATRQMSERDMLSDPTARKQFIKDAENRGVNNVRWDTVRGI